MTLALLTTPFHARTAEHNSFNAWVERGGFTMPAHFGEPNGEALAARFSAVLADITPTADVRIHGEGAAALLAAACRSDVETLAAGHSRSVHWCADGGGLRGMGTVARFGADNFLLRGFEADFGWFAAAAPRFRANLREATTDRGLLLLAGPFAFAVLAAAGLEQVVRLSAGEHQICGWQGVTVTVFRHGPLNAYQVSCANRDGPAVFDRLFRAGRLFGVRLAGELALDLLQVESGIVVPGRDFTPARTPFAREPLPASVGVGDAIGAPLVLAGIDFDSDAPAPFARVCVRKADVGRTMRSLYSPALKRAIALASIAPAHAAPGTAVTVITAGEETAGRIVALPFL